MLHALRSVLLFAFVFCFFSRSSCEWPRKRASTLNRSSRRNCLMGRRRQGQGKKLKNQSQVQTAALRLALAGMYMHVQQPFCIFIFKHCSPKMLPGRKRQSKRGSVGSLFPFAEVKRRLCIQVEQDPLRVCTFSLSLSLILALKVLFACCLAEPLETDPLSGDARGGVPTTGWWLTWQQLRALFIKRWLYARRSRRGFLAQVTTGRTFKQEFPLKQIRCVLFVKYIDTLFCALTFFVFQELALLNTGLCF